jgi:hypothetical protein
MLTPEASAHLRDRLLGELDDFGSEDDAALWAKRCIPQKNTLTTADAQCVETGFKARLASFVPDAAEAPPALIKIEKVARDPDLKTPKNRTRSKHIDTTVDKSLLMLAEPRRIRDRDHMRFVATQPCLVCGRRPSDAHHLRFAQSRALGRKVSDGFTVPLCRGHH